MCSQIQKSSVLQVRTSHTDVIIIVIMMIQSIVWTPTLPNQDQEKA